MTEGVVTYVELVKKRKLSQEILAIEVYELNESLILRLSGSLSLLEQLLSSLRVAKRCEGIE